MNRIGYWAVLRIVWCVLLCVCLFGCGKNTKDGKDEKAELRRRAEKFGDLLVSIQKMSKEKAKKKLKGYIEPSSKQKERIDQYYNEFSAASKKFKIVSQSVNEIEIGSDGKNATVEYKMIAQIPGGSKMPFAQETKWKRVKKKWYRTIKDPKKRLDHR